MAGLNLPEEVGVGVWEVEVRGGEGYWFGMDLGLGTMDYWEIEDVGLRLTGRLMLRSEVLMVIEGI